MEKFLNSYNLSTCLDAFLSNGYDDLKQLTELSVDELHDVATDVNMTMKGHVRRFVSGITATKSVMNKHPTPPEKEDMNHDVKDDLAPNFSAQQCTLKFDNNIGRPGIRFVFYTCKR